MVTEFEIFLSENQVITKSIRLNMAVERLLQKKKVIFDLEIVPPHRRINQLNDKMDSIFNAIENLDDILKAAVKISISEMEINSRPTSFSSEEDLERSANNQLSLEGTFVQQYAVLLANNGRIEELNEIVDKINFNAPEENFGIVKIVDAIFLIYEYNFLYSKLQALENTREVENLKNRIKIKEDENRILNTKLFEYDKFIISKTSNKTSAYIKALPKTLIELFEHQSMYVYIMGELANKELIEQNTFIWRYKKKGYKQLVCALLKDMEFKGYFKNGVSLSWELCKIISSNTFKVQIQSNKTFYDATLSPYEENIIPFASTIDR